jgi:hypothetical protein
MAINVQGGTPPKTPEEAATFKGEWMNFFNKLKTDQNMQQAMLNFAAQVTQPNQGGTVPAVTGALANSVGGYRQAVASDEQAKAAARRQAMLDSLAMGKGGAEIDNLYSQIDERAVNAKKTEADIGKTEADTTRQVGAVDLDKARAELARAQAALAKAKQEGKSTSQQATHLDKMAKALVDMGEATNMSEAYLLATEIDKNPTAQQIGSDLVTSQGFLYKPEELGGAVQGAVEAVRGAGGRGPGATPPIAPPGAMAPSVSAPTPVPDLSLVRQGADAYSQKMGLPPLSDAKVLELQKNPSMFQQMMMRLNSPGG